MKITRIAALAYLAVSIGVTLSVTPSSGNAQSSRDIPAEFPPSTYKAKQYVDSRGCVYVRAGIDGAVNWIPRVNRKRQVICGASPSLAKADTRPVTPQKRSADVVQITNDTPPAAAPAPKPKPKPVAAAPAPARVAPAPTRVVRAAPKPKPAPVVVTRAPVKTVASKRPAPKVVRRAAPAPARIVKPVAPVVVKAPPKVATRKVVKVPARTANNACQGASAISNRYINSGEQAPVRCGPQTEPIVTIVRTGETPKPGQKNVYYNRPQPSTTRSVVSSNGVSGDARILPSHLYDPNNLRTSGLTIPKGYRAAWDDDRLNTRRANQTLNGRSKMLLVWTNTTPRELIDQRTGRNVSALHPKLIYPFTDYSKQKAFLSTKGTTKVAKAPTVRKQQARVSTRSAPRKPAATVKGRFVQVATYSDKGQADATARRLQRSGMPVKFGLKKNGQRIVLAGPFKSNTQAGNALRAIKKAGYNSAFVRR